MGQTSGCVRAGWICVVRTETNGKNGKNGMKSVKPLIHKLLPFSVFIPFFVPFSVPFGGVIGGGFYAVRSIQAKIRWLG